MSYFEKVANAVRCAASVADHCEPNISDQGCHYMYI